MLRCTALWALWKLLSTFCIARQAPGSPDHLISTNRQARQYWKPDHTVSGENNFCHRGKVLPQLFVLGAPKCATTSLAADLTKAGVTSLGAEKEFPLAWWVQDKRKSFSRKRGRKTGIRESFLEMLPNCSTEHQQMVATYSPSSLSKENAPILFKHLYPSGAGMFQRVRFITLLREPLARIQSHWYMNAAKAERKGAKIATRSGTFQAFVSSEMQHNKYGHGKIIFMGSFYGWQLSNWRRHASPAQFVVIPFRIYTEKASRICHLIDAITGFAMNCNTGAAAGGAQIKNTREHPSLNDDTTWAFRKRFDMHMKQDHDLLLQVLANGNREGMHLPFYKGAVGNQYGIENWLKQWW